LTKVFSSSPGGEIGSWIFLLAFKGGGPLVNELFSNKLEGSIWTLGLSFFP
jgi:hypothetical protein